MICDGICVNLRWDVMVVMESVSIRVICGQQRRCDAICVNLSDLRASCDGMRWSD